MRNKGFKKRLYTPREGESWICAKCGKPIDALPFIPSKGRPVYHRECLPPRE